MAQWQHGGGFSVDGSVRIAAADRAGRERRLRYCARPPFALDRLRELDPDHLLYESTKQGPGGNGPQRLTPLELLDRLATLVPPPRIHRHRSPIARQSDPAHAMKHSGLPTPGAPSTRRAGLRAIPRPDNGDAPALADRRPGNGNDRAHVAG